MQKLLDCSCPQRRQAPSGTFAIYDQTVWLYVHTVYVLQIVKPLFLHKQNQDCRQLPQLVEWDKWNMKCTIALEKKS